MEAIQYLKDEHGRKTAVVVAIDEWERIQKAKNLLEHVYLAGIIEDRRHSKPTCSLNDLLKQEGVLRDSLES
jgi:hypothetical protein